MQSLSKAHQFQYASEHAEVQCNEATRVWLIKGSFATHFKMGVHAARSAHSGKCVSVRLVSLEISRQTMYEPKRCVDVSAPVSVSRGTFVFTDEFEKEKSLFKQCRANEAMSSSQCNTPSVAKQPLCVCERV